MTENSKEEQPHAAPVGTAVGPANVEVSVNFANSSNLSQAEYDPYMRVLTLHFRKGGLYEYIDVDRKLFEDHIRGKFEYLKRINHKK